MKEITIDPKGLLKNNWHIILLIIIVYLGFWLRAVPIRYGELGGLDEFYIYRISEYALQHNWQLPALDTMRYYPLGVSHYETEYMTPVYLPAFIYVFLSALGMKMAYFNWALVYPAIMGGLAVLAAYFLGKEMFDRKAGLLAAFFTATTTSFIIRTVGTSFEKEATAGVFMILSVFLFIKAYRKGSWLYGMLAGLSLGFMGLGWGGITYFYLLFAGFVGLLFIASFLVVVLNYLFSGFKNIQEKLQAALDERMVKAYVPTLLGGQFVQMIFPRHVSFTSNYTILAFAVMALLLARYGAKRLKLVKEENIPYIIPGLTVTLLLVVVVGSMFIDPLGNIMQQMFSFISINKGVIGSTVAENAPGDWGEIAARTSNPYSGDIIQGLGIPSFINGMANFPLFTLWGLSWLGLILLLYSFFRTQNWFLLFPVFWLATSWFSVFTYIRLVYLVGPAASLVGAFAISYIIDKGRIIEKTRTKLRLSFSLRNKEKSIGIISVALAIVVFFVAIFNYSSAYVFVQQISPAICLANPSILIDGQKCLEVSDTDGSITYAPSQPWYQAMGFLRDSTPPNSVILSWWDFGYWFQSRGNRTSMADGGNLGGAYHHRDYDIADWFTSPAAAWDGENRTLGYYFDDIAHHNFTMYILMDYTLPGKYGAISKISSRGSDVVGFLQFSQSGNFQQDNRTIVEFKADPYALWVPFDNNSNVVGSPMLLTSQGNQYYSKVYVNDLCTTKGIIHVGDESPKLGGCVALSSVGVFFIPEVAEKNMFVNLMFMDGYNLPVEKVFDNQWIKIYKVDEIE